MELRAEVHVGKERADNEKTLSLIKRWRISREDNDVGVGEHEKRRCVLLN